MIGQIRGFSFCVVTLAAVSLAACGGGGGGSPAAPVTPPSPVLNDSTPPATSGALTTTYDGQTLTYTSQDGSCQGSILLSVDDPNFTVIANNSTCDDLFKTTFTLVCHQDDNCIGRLDAYKVNILAQITDPAKIAAGAPMVVTFTVTNDVENVPQTMKYTAHPTDSGAGN